jgi:hypothetical protein
MQQERSRVETELLVLCGQLACQSLCSYWSYVLNWLVLLCGITIDVLFAIAAAVFKNRLVDSSGMSINLCGITAAMF